MQYFEHFDREDTARVTIHLSADENKSLRMWMHATDDDQPLALLHGVRLLRRGFGWYRLESNNDFRAIDKLRTSLAVIKKWSRDYENRRSQDRRLQAARTAPNSKVQSFHSHDHSFKVVNSQTGATTIVPLVEPRPADPNKLTALVAKFGPRSARR